MHDLTDVDEFTVPITVPDGTDSRSNAAEVVEAIAQALANRTFLLFSHAAFHDAGNTFSAAGNTFEEPLSTEKGIQDSNPASGEAALTAFASPDDDPAPGNRWKNIIEALIGGGLANANIWTGIPSHDGQLLFTINAYWDAGSLQWNQSTNTLHSFALMMSHSGVVTLSRVNSGSPAWASWPVTGDSLLRVGDITVGDDISAGGDISATGNVSATLDVTAGDDVRAGGDFDFTTPRTEYRAINLTAGFSSGTPPGVTGSTIFSHFDGSKWRIGDRGAVSFPVVERAGNVLKQTRFIISNPSGVDDTVYNISLIRMHSQVFGTATPPTYQTVDTVLDTVLAGETKTVTLDWGDLTVDSNEWYFIFLSGPISPPTEHYLHAVQLQCERLGPDQ